MLNRKGKQVAMISKIHLAVPCYVIAQNLDGLVHGYQPSIGVLSRENSLGRGVVSPN
jgi:hypothetical protein